MQLPEIRQLINLYVERVVVYRKHVEVYLHMLPVFCAQNHEACEAGKTETKTPALRVEVLER